MATRVRNPIESKSGRDKLAPRREPYWWKLAQGQHIGYRCLAQGEGTWIAKYRDDQTGERTIRSLGAIADTDKAAAYSLAKRQAEQWFRELAIGVEPEPKTVRDFCRQYEASLGEPDAPRRRRAVQDFTRLVYSDPIASVEGHRLRAKHFEDWRARMEAAPIRIGRSKRTKAGPRPAATINRDMVSLRAAMNLALKKRQMSTDITWLAALAPTKGADGRRELYLDREQRKRLLEAADAAVKPFLRACALLPVRPGALAALTAGDFNARQHVLTIRNDKGKEPRAIKLPANLVEFFREQTRDKLPAAPLFAQPNGRPWNRNEWAIRMRAAVADAKLPKAATVYSLRHSTITDLVTDNKLDLLTIAAIAGTSVRMIEKHYGKLRQDFAAAGLAALTL